MALPIAGESMPHLDQPGHAEEGALLLQVSGESEAAVFPQQYWRRHCWRQKWRVVGIVVAAVLLVVGAGATAWSGRWGWGPRKYFRDAMPEVKELATGCADGPLPGPWDYTQYGASVRVKVLSYNLFWWSLFRLRSGNDDSASKLIEESSANEPFDLMGFQECHDAEYVLDNAGIGGEYTVVQETYAKSSSLCMAYRTAGWTELDIGTMIVAEDKQEQYFGKRSVQWVRLQHLKTGKTVFFLNHHGPLPVDTGGICGGPSTAYAILHVISRNAVPGDAIIVVGDFNAGTHSETVWRMEERLNRVFHGVVDDGIDNIFSNTGPMSVIETTNLGNGGSDHDALSAVFELGDVNSAAGLPLPLPSSPSVFEYLQSRLRGALFRLVRP